MKDPHFLEHRHKIVVFFTQFLVVVHQDRIDVGIGHPLFRLDDARENIIGDHFPIRIQFHFTGHRQTVFMRQQGTDAVR
ncbi:hypothetical protein SDC9_76383 [bioreactor metagenome]|uniref:Uncharacterized protein n=1 Tax=bioreactor metagenome TaxID=1076179 RepID=A0A644YMI4_9ZZZZ